MFRVNVLYDDIYNVEKSQKLVGVKWCVIHKELTNKETRLTVLCSVVRQAASGRARKKCRGKHQT